MESFFSMFGINSSKGQLYEPVDAGALMYYKEAKNGPVLGEGITEAGAMSSFIAAGTAYSNLGMHMIPFFSYYSMFGFQRIGDLIWAAGDSRVKGFLVGGTSGRTTLNGEGLQHEDGQSQLTATTIPNLVAYDPAYAYELAVIIQDGLRRMYAEGEDIFYYLSIYNENYVQPPMPEGDHVRAGILQGMYKLKSVEGDGKRELRPQLFGSGTILREVLRGQEILAEKYGIGSDVWSVTSYSELAREARAAARWNRLHPTEKPRPSYLEQLFGQSKGPFIASSDNVQLVADQVREWLPGTYTALGTDGYGRSDTRPKLRRHFEIDAEFVAYSTCEALSRHCNFDRKRLPEVLRELEIDPDKVDPAYA
jgi:pyruvate dehydrogenase E1 component